MVLNWRKFDEDSKNKILEPITKKPLYKVKLKNGSEFTAFVKNHRLVKDSFDQSVVNMDEIEEYAVIGETSE